MGRTNGEIPSPQGGQYIANIPTPSVAVGEMAPISSTGEQKTEKTRTL